MKRIFVIMFSLIISGCSSIPLGTMLQLSSFDEKSFLELNPEELKIKIQIDKPVKIKVDQTDLTMVLETSKGKTILDYPLKVLSIKDFPPRKKLFTPLPGRTEYDFLLSKEAINNFHTLQSELRTDYPKKLNFSVGTGFDDFSEKLSKVTLSIFIKLDEDDGYITLFDRAPIEIERSE